MLKEYGFGEFIRHRIGHGMGIQGHEAPWLSVGDETLLKPSMIFSNEPGIYRPGVDGYRIIDSMLVTPTGGRRLSRYLSEHGPNDRVIPV
jgi:Xaa-Pro aminopeptidase